MRLLRPLLALVAALLVAGSVAAQTPSGVGVQIPLQNLPLASPLQPSDLFYVAQGPTYTPVRATAAQIKTFIGTVISSCSNASNFACLDQNNIFTGTTNTFLGSIVLDSATGGSQGAGTLNATNIFINGISLTNSFSPKTCVGGNNYACLNVANTFLAAPQTVNDSGASAVATAPNTKILVQGTQGSPPVGDAGPRVTVNGFTAGSSPSNFGGEPAYSVACANGTPSAPTALVDSLCASPMLGYAFDGTNWALGWRMDYWNDSASGWTPTDHGSGICFGTTPIGSTSPGLDDLCIDNHNGIIVGGSGFGVTPQQEGFGTVNAAGLYIKNVAVVPGGGGINLQQGPLLEILPNDTSTGTAAGKLVSLTTLGQVKTATTAQTTDAVGVCYALSGFTCGTSSNAAIAIAGQVPCVLDNGTTAGDWIIVSTTVTGDCHDAGATVPTGVSVMGVALTTNGGAGTYQIDMDPVGIANATAKNIKGCGFSFTGDVTNSGCTITIKSSVALAGSPTTTTQATGDATTKIATDQFVANAVTASNPAIAVSAATTAAANTSAWTYANGAAGVGATFTGPVNTAITIDGFTYTSTTQSLLVKNDTQSPSGAFNGVFSLTALQTVATGAVFTRRLDYDMPSDINNTGAIPVVNGTANASTTWVLTSSVATIGTDPLTFTQFSIAPTAAANTVAGNFTGSSAIHTYNAVPSCSGTGNALNYTSGTGLGCPTHAVAGVTNSAGATVGLGGDIYVNGSTGSDSNNCTSSGTACLTGGHALSLLPPILAANYTIHFADHTYAECLNITGHIGWAAGSITITGNDTTPTNVLFTGQCSTVACVTCGLSVNDGAAVLIDGIAVEPSSASTWSIFVAATPFVQLKAVTMAGSITGGFSCQFSGLCSMQGTIVVNNWTGHGIDVESGAHFTNNASMTMTMVPNASGGNSAFWVGSTAIMDTELGGTITIGTNNVTAVLNADGGQIFDTLPITATNASTPGGSAVFFVQHTGVVHTNATMTMTKFTNSCNGSGNGVQQQDGSNSFTTVGAHTVATGGQCGTT